MLLKPDLNKPAFVMNPKLAAAVKEGYCPFCGKEILEAEFKDELSKKEYGISGMCQHCQDSIFGG